GRRRGRPSASPGRGWTRTAPSGSRGGAPIPRGWACPPRGSRRDRSPRLAGPGQAAEVPLEQGRERRAGGGQGEAAEPHQGPRVVVATGRHLPVIAGHLQQLVGSSSPSSIPTLDRSQTTRSSEGRAPGGGAAPRGSR